MNSIFLDVVPLWRNTMLEELCTEGPGIQQQPPNKARSFRAVVEDMVEMDGTAGGICKRVIREGIGSVLGIVEYESILIDYSAYVDNVELPIKWTVFPETVSVDFANAVPPLKVMLMSMKVQEQAQFLVAPRYIEALITKGFLNEVKPHGEIVLFEMEVKQSFKGGQSVLTNFITLEGDEPRVRLNSTNSFELDVEYYRMLEAMFAGFDNPNQPSFQGALNVLHRARTGLLACWTSVDEPFLAWRQYKKLYLTDPTRLSYCAYLYIAKALTLLSHYDCAEVHLRNARTLKPDCDRIGDYLQRVLDMKQRQRQREYDFRHHLYNYVYRDFKKVGMLPDFADFVANFCKDLAADKGTKLFTLPDCVIITDQEMLVLQRELVTNQMILVDMQQGNKKVQVIWKPIL